MDHSHAPASIAECRIAAQRQPGRSDLQVNLGVVLQQAGDLPGAVQCFKRAIELDPASGAAYSNLGSLFASLRDWQSALTFLRAAVTLAPAAAEIHNNLGGVYFELGHFEDSRQSYRQALASDPVNGTYLNNLGNVLRFTGAYTQAEDCFRRALQRRPDYAEAHVNLGFACFVQGRMDEAETHNRRAIELKPDFALAHCNLAQILLKRGAFAEGWLEHEWRWQWIDFPSPKRNFSQPQWFGQEITGDSIFVHAEQGFGDTIQFLRYVPLLAARGARVVLEVHPELMRLAATAGGIAHLIARGDPIPDCDWHCPMMSLPLAFATDLQTISAGIPYLFPDLPTPQWIDTSDCETLRVGLVWAGSRQNRIDRTRSLAPEVFSAMLPTEGASFYSLQQGMPTGSLEVIGQLPASADFIETAAAIMSLDLVVTVDTSIAHLAGALGRPVWILLPFVADWRWLVGRADSPWYPTARLFRQPAAGEWNSVIDRVATELRRQVILVRSA